MEENAVIQVERDKSMTDALRAYKVVVDGETAGKVRRGKRVRVDVAPGQHEVWMKIDWTKSAPIELELQPWRCRQPASGNGCKEQCSD